MPQQKALTPQQAALWEAYINPESDTFGDATNSARKAGYAESFCDTVAQTDWFDGLRRRYNMRKRGEQVLEEMLEMPVKVLEHSREKDEQGNPIKYVATDTGLVKIKQDTAKFVVERLGKDEWSSRSELTGADGAPLVDPDKKKKSDALLNDLLDQKNP